MVSVLVVQPHRPVLRPDRGNERLAVRRHRNSFLRRWAKGELLWFSIWKTLPPDVKVIRLGCEIDPFTIRRPRARKTRPGGRAYNSNFVRALEWNDTAGNNFASAVHLNNEYPSAVRRKVGMMGHTAFAGGHVDVPAISPALIRGHHRHVQSFFDLREEQPLSAFNPCQRGSVGQQQVRFATENRYLPGVKGPALTVGNTRIIRRKRRGQFWLRIVGQLDGLASRQQLYVEISRC